MDESFATFRRIVRNAHRFSDREPIATSNLHAFDSRNIHPALPPKVRILFDDGHYSESTFEAFKFIDKRVAKLAKSKDFGFSLMMAVFDETKALVKLTPLSDISEVNEQKGYRFFSQGQCSPSETHGGTNTALLTIRIDAWII